MAAVLLATAILFESSGGQTDKSAHLPELRFALGEPGLETTSIDLAASQMEARGFFIRPRGTDGFQFGFKPTLKKVVSDRRASLDEEEVLTETKRIVQKEFERNKSIPVLSFPDDAAAVQESTKLSLVVLSPEQEWSDNGLRSRLSEWTRNRGGSPRLYPAALIWCVRKQGRELRNKVEALLAWRKVNREYLDGTLGGEFDRSDSDEINAKLRDADESAVDEVWASYRYLALYDNKSDGGLNIFDLGAGHANSGETLTSRVVTTLKTRALLNESPGAGYLERRWPEPFKKSGAWPVSALRQAFLNGTLERLLDPDSYIRNRLPEFILRGDFGFASGLKPEGGYSRVWFSELLPAEEISFDSDVYLLLGKTAEELKKSNGRLIVVEPSTAGQPTESRSGNETPAGPLFGRHDEPTSASSTATQAKTRTLRISGEIPTEVWNRLGRTLLPKLKTGSELQLSIDASIQIEVESSNGLCQEIEQILRDLNLADKVKIDLK